MRFLNWSTNIYNGLNGSQDLDMFPINLGFPNRDYTSLKRVSLITEFSLKIRLPQNKGVELSGPSNSHTPKSNESVWNRVYYCAYPLVAIDKNSEISSSPYQLKMLAHLTLNAHTKPREYLWGITTHLNHTKITFFQNRSSHRRPTPIGRTY